MLFNVIKPAEGEDVSDSDDEENDKGAQILKNSKIAAEQTVLSEKGKRFRNKLKFVASMLKMQKTLRFAF